MKKRMFTLWLSACIGISSIVCPIDVQANVVEFAVDVIEPLESAETDESSWFYKINEQGTIEVAKYVGAETDVVIPREIDGKTVTSVGMGTFYMLNNINSVTIPDCVTTIDRDAFYGCSSLRSVIIPDSVISIGECAFSGCVNLSNLVIPSSISNIGRGAFGGVKEIILENNDVYVLENGILYNRTKTEIIFCAGNKTGIVVVPSSVTTIGWNAFECCSNITDIIIPNTVTNIGANAFYGCSSIRNIIIPDSVSMIDGSTFLGCSSLSSITIPSSVTKIGGVAFGGCDNLKDVYYTGSEEQWKGISIWDLVVGGYSNDALFNAAIHYNSPMPDIPMLDTSIENESIRLGELNVSKSNLTYNGKAQTPAITVTDANGQPVDATNYTVTYTDNKKVGQATVTVTGKGNYTGTLKATFKILPKETTLSKVTAKKKAVAVKWKKQTKEVTGYQIQYSTSKKFKGAKNVTIKKNKTTSTTVKKLKANKKYYVRIRTYKTVKISGKSQKLYSEWSKSKNVKTKK